MRSTTSQGRRAPSQRDVARRAGVSRTTVSLVLNGRADASIPEATRQRVWDAAAALGHRPNAYARGLRGTQTHVIGLLTDDIATTPYAVQIIKGAQDAAHAAGYTLMIIDTHGEADAADAALGMMASWRVDGVVYATDYHREIVPSEHLRSTPSVLVDCRAPGSGIPAIVPDEAQGGRTATETLIAAGHRRIGIITGPDGFPASAGRLDGYHAALDAAGIERDPDLITIGDWWQESGYDMTHRLLDLDEPPTAIFCCNDWMAMGAYDALRELGRSIPDDVAIIGSDDRREIADHMHPRLTTVALPYYEMGRRGVELVLDPERLAAVSTEDGSITAIECPLVRRESA
jgi:LacI family transcriptional regulator, galactose operon repressor